MSFKVLILGASYGSLLGTKLLMAGHDVTLVCRKATAALFNGEGSDVRIKLRDESDHRSFKSAELPGALDAMEPADVRPEAYDLVVLAMSEPQYAGSEVKTLMSRIALAKVPCLSLMNMPPMPYLKRIPGLDAEKLAPCFNSLEGWRDFDPGLVSLCSPDPQAFRPPETGGNVLHVGLPTNFKAAPFEAEAHNDMLRALEADIDAIRLDGKEVPVKLRVYDSLFVPFAKWAMLLTGNYRCVESEGVRPIQEAVHGDIETSQAIYQSVTDLVVKLGATPESQVPFEKYAKAAEGLLKPSSAARAIDGGAQQIERVDLLVQLIAQQLGMGNASIDAVVETVTARLDTNRRQSAAA
ncbi:MAG: hypothetical protein AAF718_03685 [Pseudomonadota bacterium]